MNINAQTILAIIGGIIAMWFLLKKGSVLPFGIPSVITIVILTLMFGFDGNPNSVRGILITVTGIIVGISYGFFHYRHKV